MIVFHVFHDLLLNKIRNETMKSEYMYLAKRQYKTPAVLGLRGNFPDHVLCSKHDI